MPGEDSIDAGLETVTNTDGSSILVSGKDSIDVEDAISQISYSNQREYPTPGRRSLKLSSTITCTDGKVVKVPQKDTYVMVMPADQPSISINGTPNLAREYEAFMQGIELFSSVSIIVNQENAEDEANDMDDDVEDGENNNSAGVPASVSKLANEHKLDSCNIQVYPPLNPDHEYFRVPTNMMEQLEIRHKETKDGIVVYGADSVNNYQQILRQLVYFNRKPAYYLNRAFKLSCSELNGRFSSNDYIQTLTVIHPKIEPTPSAVDATKKKNVVEVPVSVAHAQLHEHSVDYKEPRMKVASAGFFDNSIVDTSESFARATPSHAVTVIIVICVGFLVFMIVLGVIRIRSAHHRGNDLRDDEQEMTWDDTALTITVNPLDQIEQEQETQHLHDEEDESGDSSDDVSSYHEDGDSSEEEPGPVKGKTVRRGDLEWDDTNF